MPSYRFNPFYPNQPHSLSLENTKGDNSMDRGGGLFRHKADSLNASPKPSPSENGTGMYYNGTKREIQFMESVCNAQSSSRSEF